jgi:alpha-1,3-mannosyltransferase
LLVAAAVAEKPAGSADRRPLYFAAFLLLADAALVALIIAFVPCLYSPTQTVLLFLLSTAALLSIVHRVATKIDWDAYMSQVLAKLADFHG